MNPLPPLAAEAGAWVDRLFWHATALTAVAFAAVVGALGWFAWRYRARPGHHAVYDRGDSPRAVAATVGLAAAVFIGVDLTLAVHDHAAWGALFAPPAAEPVRVEVLARQFEWQVRYAGPDDRFGTADDRVFTNELRAPAGRPVEVRLRSRDVIHSFCLPNMRVKQDAVPGLTTRIVFTPTVPGEYEIACAELCGLAHYSMRGVLVVEADAAAFESWLAAAEPASELYYEDWGWDWR